MMKWKPFISMVEQQQAVYRVLQDLQKIEKPVLDESQHEENSHRVLSAYYSGQILKVVYYEQGVLKSCTGYIEKLNEAYRYFILNEGGGAKKRITFDSVIEVS